MMNDFRFEGSSRRAGVAILAGGMLFSGAAQADEVYRQDFEGLTLAPAPGYTRPIYTDMIPGWVRDNTAMAANAMNLAYDGGTAMNVLSWQLQQGLQLGRGEAPGGPYLTGDAALVFDGDAWDDFLAGGAGSAPLGFNSRWSVDVSLAGFDRNTAEIAFSWEFASYDFQRGLVEVSFDGGTSWQTLLEQDSFVLGFSVLSGAFSTYTAGTNFNPTSDAMTIRVSMLDADNDWWFAFDNLVVTADTLGGGCRPDLTTGAVPGQPGYGVPNGTLNNDDFFYYLAQFAAGNVAVADLTTGAVSGQPGYGVPNSIINNDDFFYYLAIFAAGC